MGGVDQAAASDWAGSGLAYLTGPPDGEPDFSRAAVLAEARRVTADIAELLGVEVDAATMLAGRAGILGLTRRGRISAGGATRLLATSDGWCAIALPRTEDVAALPALVEADAVPDDPWTGKPFDYRLEGQTATLTGPAPANEIPAPHNSIHYELTMRAAKGDK